MFTYQMAQDWQKDPRSLKTEKVQLWSPRTMLTRITKREAIELIKNRRCYVISSQAIGFYDTEEM